MTRDFVRIIPLVLCLSPEIAAAQTSTSLPTTIPAGSATELTAEQNAASKGVSPFSGAQQSKPPNYPPSGVHPPPKKEKSTSRALALSLGVSAFSYVGLGFGAQVFASGFTRGVAFGMLGLTGAVIGPSTGKIYLHKGGSRLALTTALRFVAATTVITGLVLAGDQIADCSLSDCGLIYGGTTALVGVGIYDLATTRD